MHLLSCIYTYSKLEVILNIKLKANLPIVEIYSFKITYGLNLKFKHVYNSCLEKKINSQLKDNYSFTSKM